MSETFHALWFSDVNDKNAIAKRILHITDTVKMCSWVIDWLINQSKSISRNDALESFEQLLHGLLKNADERTLNAAKWNVQQLVVDVLNIDASLQGRWFDY